MHISIFKGKSEIKISNLMLLNSISKYIQGIKTQTVNNILGACLFMTVNFLLFLIKDVKIVLSFIFKYTIV